MLLLLLLCASYAAYAANAAAYVDALAYALLTGNK